eukprot:1745044-Alexandrium_andersonii.AAC.1
MSASLVGSEMCIRDRPLPEQAAGGRGRNKDLKGPRGQFQATGELSDFAKLRNQLRHLDPDSR